jgi:hypothetical protein
MSFGLSGASRRRILGGRCPIKTHNGHLWCIRDGKAGSMLMCPDPKKALEAAGLRA